MASIQKINIKDSIKSKYSDHTIKTMKQELRLMDNQVKELAVKTGLSCEEIQNIYCDSCPFHYECKDTDGNIFPMGIGTGGLNLELSLSMRLDTPRCLLESMAVNDGFSSEISDEALSTLTVKNVIIARNIKSTTEELNLILFRSEKINSMIPHLLETYILLSKHPNSSVNILEEVLKHESKDMYINIAKHPNVTSKILDKISCVFDAVDPLILNHPKGYVKTKKSISKHWKLSNY